VPEAAQPHLFISYASADEAWAWWIAWQLEEAGYKVKTQVWDFSPGGNFVVEMQKATVECERTVAVFSPSYFLSEFGAAEWAAAFGLDPTGKNEKLIPVRIEACQPPGLLGSIIYIDLVKLDETTARERLLTGLARGRRKPTTVPQFPRGSVMHSPPPNFPPLVAERRERKEKERLRGRERKKRREAKRERLDVERQEKERLEHEAQSQPRSPVAPSTPPAKPEAPESSAETLKVVYPPPKHVGPARREVPAPVSDASQAIDHVNFSVFAPGIIRPAQQLLLDLWVHLPTQTDKVTSLTQEFARDRRLGVKPWVAVTHGAALNVVLDLPSLRIKDPRNTIFWNGEPDYASFVVEVPADVVVGAHPGQVIITASGIPIAKVTFCLPIEAEGTRVEKAPRELPAVRHQPHSAFASFSGRDRKDVLGRVQGMTKVCQDIDVFVDVLSLRSGQDWELQIRQQIPTRDVFYLFWSFHASRSKEVEKEWRIALEMRGLDFIDPIPLTDPRVSPPPKELARLHFNDLYIAQIQMEESLKKLRKRYWWEFWRPVN
jgi:TIR domain